MPIYEFVCQQCGNEFEKIVSFSDTNIPHCPSCNRPDVKRLMGKPAIHFKGSGWYINDSKTDNKKSNTTSESKKETNSDKSDSNATESSSEKSTDTEKSAKSSESSEKSGTKSEASSSTKSDAT